MSTIAMLRTSPAKANDIFARLADTSPTALKTRERLFVELKREMDEISRLEEKLLLPVLRKGAETKELAPKLVASLKARQDAIEKLGAAPREGEDFSRSVQELKRTFQQYLRDEKNEFLPAIEKALTEEQAAALGEKVDAARAQSEAAEQRAAEERRADARIAREKAAETERLQKDAEDKRRRIAREAAAATEAAKANAERQAETRAQTAKAVAARAADNTSQVLSMVEQTEVQASAYLDYGSAVRDAVQTSARAWIGWARDTAEARTRRFGDFAQCRTPLDVMTLQSRAYREEMDLFFGAFARAADATRASAEKAAVR